MYNNRSRRTFHNRFLLCSGEGAVQRVSGENASANWGRTLQRERAGRLVVTCSVTGDSYWGEGRRWGQGYPRPCFGGHPWGLHVRGGALLCGGIALPLTSGFWSSTRVLSESEHGPLSVYNNREETRRRVHIIRDPLCFYPQRGPRETQIVTFYVLFLGFV